MIPRVLVATNMYPTAGDPARGAFVKAQVDALSELGVPVEVFHLHGERRARNYAAAIGRLRTAVRASQAEVVYAFYGLTGWVALWQPLPLVLSLAGDDILGTPREGGGLTFKSRAGIALSQWAARMATEVCVQSEEMRRCLWGADLRRRARIIPYGVDAKRFCPGDQLVARQRLGIPLAERSVIFPNTPHEPRKRLDLARSAMELVRRDIPDAHLRIVSGVPHSHMPDYYRSADCCLLTSEWEGSPNVVKEALLSGLPVVTTAVGDVKRWVALSPQSAIADRTPEALAREIRRVLAQRRRVDPAPFVATVSSRAIARQMVEIFESVVQHPPRGRG